MTTTQTTAQRIAHLNEQITNARRSAWNASQARRSPFASLAIMDELIDERNKLQGRRA